MPVSTCRLAHLSLPNSEMHVGLRAEGSARLEALVREPGTMVLFPGPAAIDVRALPAPPRTLIVVDGTWINARKAVERSPLLAALPRVGFTRAQPSNYRIRKEPAAHCLSTIEAVAHVLEELEDAPGRFTPMLGSFDHMVELQLAYIREAARGTVTRRYKRTDRVPVPDRLRALGDRLVVVFAEGRAPAQLHEWAAIRPGTGERFEARLPGETLGDAGARWHQFARPGDVPSTWGRFSVDLLRGVGIQIGEHLDLKRLISNFLHARLGGVEHLARSLGPGLSHDEGRAERKVTALDTVLRALLDGTLRAPPKSA